MMWFRKRREEKKYHKYLVDEKEWITVPFRYAEAARVSIYTIAKQPGVPVHLQGWISQWLASYNSQLIAYMRENYGPGVFPLLDRITRDVMPEQGREEILYSAIPEEFWEKWERQFKEE